MREDIYIHMYTHVHIHMHVHVHVHLHIHIHVHVHVHIDIDADADMHKKLCLFVVKLHLPVTAISGELSVGKPPTLNLPGRLANVWIARKFTFGPPVGDRRIRARGGSRRTRAARREC